MESRAKLFGLSWLMRGDAPRSPGMLALALSFAGGARRVRA